MSFNSSLPTDKDAARSILGDTDSSSELLADATITANLTVNGWNDGLALCADAIASIYARRAESYTDGLTGNRTQWADRAGFYRDLAAKARAGVYPSPNSTNRPSGATFVASWAGRTDLDNSLI